MSALSSRTCPCRFEAVGRFVDADPPQATGSATRLCQSRAYGRSHGSCGCPARKAATLAASSSTAYAGCNSRRSALC